jgi:hypothetical protein
MDRDIKRLVLAAGAGLTMALSIWLFVGELSPARSYLQDHAAGHVLMVLNLPALFIGRILSGTPPSEVVVYVACFIQWFAIGLVASAVIWREPAAAQQGVPGDVAASRRRA